MPDPLQSRFQFELFRLNSFYLACTQPPAQEPNNAQQSEDPFKQFSIYSIYASNGLCFHPGRIPPDGGDMPLDMSLEYGGSSPQEAAIFCTGCRTLRSIGALTRRASLNQQGNPSNQTVSTGSRYTLDIMEMMRDEHKPRCMFGSRSQISSGEHGMSVSASTFGINLCLGGGEAKVNAKLCLSPPPPPQPPMGSLS